MPVLPVDRQELLGVLLTDGLKALLLAPMGGIIGFDVGRLRERLALRGIQLEDADLPVLEVVEGALLENERESRRRRRAERNEAPVPEDEPSPEEDAAEGDDPEAV